MTSLLGRGGPLAELSALLDGAAAGRGALALVTGEAGIGKTRLCEEVATLAAGRGVDVTRAACWESGAVPAYWPWEQVVRRLAGHPLEAPAAGSDPDLGRARLFETVTALLAEAAAAGPRLVLLDDLHWADVPSVHLLSHVAGRLADMAVLVVGTYRDDEVAPDTALGAALAGLARHGRRVALSGLDVAEMGPLAAEVTGGDPASVAAEALHRHTHGNPLYARELVRLLAARGALDALGAGGPLPVPDTVRGVLDGRLERLSAPCRAVLEVGAVVGDQFALDVVAGVLPPDRRDAILDAVDEAESAAVVREAGVSRWSFAHPLMRSTLYEELGVARRVRLHQRVGEVLEARHAAGGEVDLAAVSHHFVQAAPAGTAAKAVAYAAEAAERAMAVLAYEDAAALYRQAIAALDLAPEAADRAELLIGLGAALGAAGDRAGARAACEQAAALARDSRRPHQLARAALGSGSGGMFEVDVADAAQIALLEEALRALGDEPSTLRAEVGARLSIVLWRAGTEERRLAVAERAVADARAAGAGAPLVAALAAHCDAVPGPAHTELRLAEATEVVELGLALADPAAELLGRRLRLVAQLENGDMAAADAEIDAYAATASTVRRPLYAWYVPLWRAMRALMQGDLASCDRWNTESAAIGAQAHSGNADMLTSGQWWFRLREAGEFEEPLSFVEGLQSVDAAFQYQLRVSAALILAESGRQVEAVAMLDAAAGGLRSAPVDSEWIPMLGQAAEAVWLVGGHPVARWLYDALLPFRHRFGVEGIGAVCWGSVERVLGLLAATLGLRAEAEAHFGAALAANRRLGADLVVALTLRDAALALGDAGLRAEAAGAFRRLGLDQMVARLEGAGGAGGANVFRLEGETWTATFAGATVHLKDAKGLHDLARLLARPGAEVAAVELSGRSAVVEGGAGDLLDDRARAAYRARLVELDRELDDADAAGDAGRSARAEAERDALLAQLSSAFGLGGRARKAGDPAEKARVAVTWRIKDAVKRVEAVHPDLGRHLRRSVRTGAFCVYDPDPPTTFLTS
ncbi:MAG TPA: AAA family ATPase [Acidimicrobiales bacterium]|nr:AAA family ATPase [Acidimicrobiales bacterium]